tara:strand:+ start:426 stop:710 length:285 start_codon:yes stop_codon:yes gene_type:complete
MKKKLASDEQVRGDHYKNKGIQPLEYIYANNLSYCEGNILKYITRKKENKVADLLKAKHFIDLALEIEHGRDSDGNWLEADTEERFPKTNVEKP